MPAVRFKDGPLDGQLREVEFLGPAIWMTEFVWEPAVFKLPLAAPTNDNLVEVRYVRWTGPDERGVYTYRYANPVPALNRRIRSLELDVARLERELSDREFGSEYRNAAFQDGLGGW